MLSLQFSVSVEKIPPRVNRSRYPSAQALITLCSPRWRRRLPRASASANRLPHRENGMDVNGRTALEGDLAEPELQPLPSGLRRELMPRHIAVIMDGSARWAFCRGLPASSGHEAGVAALKELVELSGKWGIRILTVFAFSSDNWSRPKAEVDFLMSLFQRSIESELQSFSRVGYDDIHDNKEKFIPHLLNISNK